MVDGGPAVSTRERIVEAACGIRALTLDRLAGHAKLSKGAVLYHFKGKDEPIQAMLRRAVTGCVWASQVAASTVVLFPAVRETCRVADLFWQSWPPRACLPRR